MAATSSGNPELDAFCEAEHRRLVGLLALHVGSRRIAEELAQDAFIKLCQHWPRVRDMADRRAWLNRVALNLANSWWRRRYAEGRAYVRHGPPEESAAEEPADTLAVRKAVAALPRRQRTALVLRYYEQLPAAEAAELMGCAEATVRSLTHRAIQTLRNRTSFTGDHLAPREATNG